MFSFGGDRIFYVALRYFCPNQWLSQSSLRFQLSPGSVSHAAKEALFYNPACCSALSWFCFMKSSDQTSRLSHSQSQLPRLWLSFGQFGKLMGDQLFPAATGRQLFPSILWQLLQHISLEEAQPLLRSHSAELGRFRVQHPLLSRLSFCFPYVAVWDASDFLAHLRWTVMYFQKSDLSQYWQGVHIAFYT